MTPEQKNRISKMTDQLEALSSELDSSDVSNLYVATDRDSEGSLVLSVNREGAVYLALTLLSLANEARPDQHFHFDPSSLDHCDQPLVIRYSKAPWEIES